MKKEGIIFTDMNGTLVFHVKEHGLQEIGKTEDGLVKIIDPLVSKTYLTYDVSTNDSRVFLDTETRKLAKKVKEKYHIILISAARKSTMDRRKNVMDFADGYILEGGGKILDSNYEIDKEWETKLDPERPYLQEIQTKLENDGWKLDLKRRSTSIRIKKKSNPSKSGEYFSLYKNFKLPSQLRMTMNLGSIDILLGSAGKGNSVSYLIEKYGYSIPVTIGIGDDINDIEMLEKTGQKFVLGNAHPEMLALANHKKWYVSNGLNFDGINEILRNLYQK